MFYKTKFFLFFCVFFSNILQASYLDRFSRMCEGIEKVPDSDKPLFNHLIRVVKQHNNHKINCNLIVSFYQRQNTLVISNDEDISNLDLLSDFYHIKHLYLLGLKNLENISSISSLVQLKKISIHHSPKIKNIFSFKDFQELEEVSLFDTRVSDVSVLHNKHKLKILDLYKNPVTCISSLMALENLHYFSLNSTKVPFGQVSEILRKNINLNKLDVRHLGFSTRELIRLNIIRTSLLLTY